jgi:energy-coupling factor transporter ATP-binding protein EcfA2
MAPTIKHAKWRMIMTLKEELIVIDEAIAELDERRTNLINKLHELRSDHVVSDEGNLIPFPTASGIVVSSHSGSRHAW